MQRRRPGYASVVATIALVLSLSGVAYATATITSADIVDGTIKTRDVSGAAQASFLPRSRYLNQTGAVSIGTSPWTTVATMSLPAGKWVVTAKAEIAATSGSPQVLCLLAGPAQEDGAHATPVAAGDSASVLTLQIADTWIAGGSTTATLECVDGGTSSSANALDVSMVAMEVGAIKAI